MIMNHLVGARDRTLFSVEPFLQAPLHTLEEASLDLRVKLSLALKLQPSCVILLSAKVTLPAWFS